MKKQEMEVRLGKSRIHFGEDKIFCATIVGEYTTEMAKLTYEFFELHKTEMMVDGKVRLFIDLTNARKASAEAKEFMHRLSNDIGKIALVGFNPVAKVIASFFMGNSKKKNINFFNTQEDAIEWLKEE
ncbi:MAG: STAS/SEC14 domain-containing protein [bacterium]